MLSWETEMSEDYGLWSIRHDVTDLDTGDKWDFVSKYFRSRVLFGSVDDVIVVVPGRLNMDGTMANNTVAAHVFTAGHVIGVSRARLQAMKRGEQVIVLAHEFLHHFLKEDIRPGLKTPDLRAHDDDGIMKKGSTEQKLGCKTVAALKRAGVTDAEMDRNYILGGAR